MIVDALRGLARRAGVGRWLYRNLLSADIRRRHWLKGTPAARLDPQFWGTADVLHWLVAHDRDIGEIWDVGANRGNWALLARSFFPSARITCFEPLALHIESLAKVADAHGPMQICQAAVGESTGVASIYLTHYSDCSSLLEPVPAGRWADALTVEKRVEIPVLRLDEYQEREKHFPDFIKLDIQGGELAAMRGGIATLARTRWLLTEVQFVSSYVGAPSAGEIFAFLSQQGFEPVCMERDSEPWDRLRAADILFGRRGQVPD